MQYQNVVEGVFQARPNRFLAVVQLDGKKELCHVKNTGRCKELLISGNRVALELSQNVQRKTKYDLIAVYRTDRWVNMDSQVPNTVVSQWMREGNLFSKEAIVVREKRYGNSRFDLYVEDGERKAFIEVKGVTLEENQVARFPDAPTQRGVKHIEELIKCVEDGYEAYLIFVIQMKGVQVLKPNWSTHRQFGEALWRARQAGVKILGYDCRVGADFIHLDQPIPVILEE